MFFLYSEGIHVYIFDSGINENHPDFGGRAKMEISFIDYEDDTDYAGHGKQWFSIVAIKYLALSIGTHVAGTIGGNKFGVAKKVMLHGVKILDRNGDGSTSSLIQGNFRIYLTII